MAVRALVLAVLVPACGFSGSSNHGDVDAMPDTPDPDGSPACTTWAAPDIGDPCNPAFGTPIDLHLTPADYNLDTTTGMLTGGQSIALPGALIGQNTGPQVRVVNLSSLMLDQGARIFAKGDNALVFVVHGSVTVDGTIDVSATTDSTANTSTPGPGGDPTACMASVAGTNAMDAGGGGGGGGGGGAFGADDAGKGGDGKAGMHGIGGAKGTPSGDPMQTSLRGGCPGAKGGDGATGANNGGRAGDGGGAIEITALASLTISGTISAGGSGGGGAVAAGPGGGGGGGGGSGGAILLDGRTVSIPTGATLCANGGGGGEGGFKPAGAPTGGENGHNPTCGSVKAPGGGMNPDGGDGGDGAFAATKAQDGAPGTTNLAGGGGGGGGVGRIRTHARMGMPQVDGLVTPAPVKN